ncbi:MAG: M43 family zinc metalloprotease [Salibacteraceae bacterium]
MRRIYISILFISVAISGFAQHNHDVPFKEDDIMLLENIKKAHPEWAADIDAEEASLEKFTAEFTAKNLNSSSRADVDYIIPVVFHILHENGPENITDTEIHDQMRILNEDFQMTNDDLSAVEPRFKSIIGDAKIEFRLARTDPQGNPTTGIDRIESSLTNNGGENSKLNVWPRSTYLNVWLVKSIASGAAGYTFLPSGAHRNPTKDGIIILYEYISSVRTGTPNRSRALTHEIGHWLNLPHLWGGTNTPGVTSNCSDDDGVFDTPNTVGWTSCNLNGLTCGSYDNVQNFMEYSYCSNMFTDGQILRMQAALNRGTAERNQLVSQANNLKAGVLDISEVAFEAENQYACINQSVQFSDKSLYGATSWLWEFEAGTPATSTDKNPVVTYSAPGNFKVKLTVKGANNVAKTKEVANYITVNKSVGTHLPIQEGFEGGNINTTWVAQNEDNDDVFWKVKNGVSYSGNSCLYLENNKNIFAQVESIVSAPIDLSNISNASLSFYIAHALKLGIYSGQSKLRVYFSGDCGNTWTQVLYRISQTMNQGNITASDYEPKTSSDWVKIDVPNFNRSNKVQNGLIKIEFENTEDNNVYIDDINISGTYDDVPVQEFPVNGMDSVSSNVYLDWKAVPVVDRYEYELYENSNLSTLVSSGSNNYINNSPNNEDSRFYATNLKNGQSYFWRVRAVRGSITSNWSPVWSFVVSNTGEGLEHIDGELASINKIENSSSFEFTMFPNPSEGEVSIELNFNLSGKATVQVYSIQGQLVFNEDLVNTNSLTIKNGELNSGLYVVNITIDGSTSSKKLIIQ